MGIKIGIIIFVVSILVVCLIALIIGGKRTSIRKKTGVSCSFGGGKYLRSLVNDNYTKSFLRGEAAFRHQTRKMTRYINGEKVRLGSIVDFLFGCDMSSHLIGMMVCPTRIGDATYGSWNPVYLEDTKQIKDFDLFPLISVKDDTGIIVSLRHENVTITLLRDNGRPLVLFYRNVEAPPFMHYIRVYCMMSGTNEKDDKLILKTKNAPLVSSTLIACQVTDKDVKYQMSFYDKIEEETLRLVEHGEHLKNNFQYQILDGMYGYKPVDSYIHNGDWMVSKNRYDDAARQYQRAINALNDPFANIHNGAAYGALNYKLASLLQYPIDGVRSFHYMDIACFFNGNIEKEYLLTLAKLADYRTIPILNKMNKKVDADYHHDVLESFSHARKELIGKVKADISSITLGFLLSHILRLHDYNIFNLSICRFGDGEYHSERIDDRKKLWNSDIKDYLQDGNTIILGYSRNGELCGQDYDNSSSCTDNSIIMHVNDISGTNLYRIDIMIPAFVYEPDKMYPTKDFIPEHRTFVIAKEPYAFDFSMESTQLIKISQELYHSHRTVEALHGFLHAYSTLLMDYYKNTVEQQQLCKETASSIGYCYMELDLAEIADYYLNVGITACEIWPTMEYVNFLANTKDVRALSIIDKLLLEVNKVNKKDQVQLCAFLKRRKAYVLIDWGMIEQAKDLLNSMLEDPLCSEFAKNELAYIRQMEQNKTSA